MLAGLEPGCCGAANSGPGAPSMVRDGTRPCGDGIGCMPGPGGAKPLTPGWCAPGDICLGGICPGGPRCGVIMSDCATGWPGLGPGPGPGPPCCCCCCCC